MPNTKKTPHEIGLEAAFRVYECSANPDPLKRLNAIISAYLQATGLDQVIVLEADAEVEVGDYVKRTGLESFISITEYGSPFDVSIERARTIPISERAILCRKHQPVVTMPRGKDASL